MKINLERISKLLMVFIALVLTLNLASCIQNNGGDDDEIPEENTKQYRTDVLTDVSPVILDELELGFKFFWETANSDTTSSGYGLIPDRFHTDTNAIGTVASIASVGFGLTTIPIGIENGWITRVKEERAYLTLKTMKT